MTQRLLLLALLLTPSIGCGSLATAGVREMSDHGRNPRYPSQSYGAHVIDAFFEPEPAPPCHTTTVIVEHHHHHH